MNLIRPPQNDAQQLTAFPQTHAWTPRTRSTADDRGHAADVVSATEQRKRHRDQIIEWPDLTFVSVAGEHQSGVPLRGFLGEDRGMGKKDGGAGWTLSKCLVNGKRLIAPAVLAKGGIIDSGNHEARKDLDVFIAKDMEASFPHELEDRFRTGVEL